jgi:hypothetical protein
MLQLHLEPLFYKYHVDVNLYVHRHSYERSCPMFDNRTYLHLTYYHSYDDNIADQFILQK